MKQDKKTISAIWNILLGSFILASIYISEQYITGLLIMLGLQYISFLFAVVVILYFAHTNAEHFSSTKMPTLFERNFIIISHIMSLASVYYLYLQEYFLFAGVFLFPSLAGLIVNIAFILWPTKNEEPSE